MNLHRCAAAVLALVLTANLTSCAAKQEPSSQVFPAENAASGTAAVSSSEAEHTPADLSGTVSVSDLRTLVSEANRADYDFTDKALEYLVQIGENYPNRNALDKGTHDAFSSWLIGELEACGYASGQIEEQPFSQTSLYDGVVKGRNIILTVPGQTNAGQIIVGAHYDGDGAGDNGSGVALLLATAAGLAGTTPQLTIRYIFFDAEEEGMLGSKYYAEHMSEEEIASTVYMINLDALAFGDFCNIYGGIYGDDYDADYIAVVEGEPLPEPEHTEGYDFAANAAETLGFRVYRTTDLDGYYAEHGRGMDPEDAFFTNPWTNANPAPMNMIAPSPATFGASDHTGFAVRGIPYIYFEATNWWAEGSDPAVAFTGYPETYDTALGDGGQFMNTEYDTLAQLEQLFPGRAEQHYRLFSPLLSALLLVG